MFGIHFKRKTAHQGYTLTALRALGFTIPRLNTAICVTRSHVYHRYEWPLKWGLEAADRRGATICIGPWTLACYIDLRDPKRSRYFTDNSQTEISLAVSSEQPGTVNAVDPSAQLPGTLTPREK